MSEEPLDVAIVGAGLSGLSAAHRLQTVWPDVKLVVLEATDRVGGRTESIAIRSPNGKEDDSLDLGAHWVASSQKEIMRLLDELGVGYYPQNISGTKIMQVGDNRVRTYRSEIPNLNSWAALIQLQRLIGRVEGLAKKVDIRDPYASPFARELDSLTVEAFLRRHVSHESVWDVMNAAMQASLGCDCSQVSLLFFLAYANSSGGVMKLLLVEDGAAQEFRVKGGTQQISVKLAELVGLGTNVLLGKPVAGIDCDGAVATVLCKDGTTFRAKRVICSTPANQTFKIAFSPPMPHARMSMLGNFNMGNLMKFYLVYETSFWLEDGFSGEVVSTGGPTGASGCDAGPATVFYDATTHKGTPVLIGFSAGKNADQWFSKTREERQAAVVRQLVSYFGPKAEAVLQFHEKDWTREPYVGGGPVSVAAPGRMHNFHLLGRSHALVHFAGTELATKWNGYMSGAVQSGHKAAAEVLHHCQPDKLKDEDRDVLKEFRPRDTVFRDVKQKSYQSWCSII